MNIKRYTISGLHPHIIESKDGFMVYYEGYANLQAENERLRKAGEWQPIETAPKFVESMFICEGLNGISFGFKGSHNWAINADTEKYRPTHWMPLPNPPPAKEGKPSA